MGPKKNIHLGDSWSQLFNYDEFYAHLVALEKENPGATARNFGMNPGELLKKTFPERFAQEMAKAKAMDVVQKTAAAMARTALWFDPASRPIDRLQPKSGEIDIFANMAPPVTGILRRALAAESLPYAVEEGTTPTRNRVTSFSDWIYHLDYPEIPSSAAQREGGRQVENLVQVRKM